MQKRFLFLFGSSSMLSLRNTNNLSFSFRDNLKKITIPDTRGLAWTLLILIFWLRTEFQLEFLKF
jgi:hypothetical protein